MSGTYICFRCNIAYPHSPPGGLCPRCGSLVGQFVGQNLPAARLPTVPRVPSPYLTGEGFSSQHRSRSPRDRLYRSPDRGRDYYGHSDYNHRYRSPFSRDRRYRSPDRGRGYYDNFDQMRRYRSPSPRHRREYHDRSRRYRSPSPGYRHHDRDYRRRSPSPRERRYRSPERSYDYNRHQYESSRIGGEHNQYDAQSLHQVVSQGPPQPWGAHQNFGGSEGLQTFVQPLVASENTGLVQQRTAMVANRNVPHNQLHIPQSIHEVQIPEYLDPSQEPATAGEARKNPIQAFPKVNKPWYHRKAKNTGQPKTQHPAHGKKQKSSEPRKYAVSGVLHRCNEADSPNDFEYPSNCDNWCYEHHHPHKTDECETAVMNFGHVTKPFGWMEAYGHERYMAILNALSVPIKNLQEFATLQQYQHDRVKDPYFQFVEERDAKLMKIHAGLQNTQVQLTTEQLKEWMRFAALCNSLTYRAVCCWISGINRVSKIHVVDSICPLDENTSVPREKAKDRWKRIRNAYQRLADKHAGDVPVPEDALEDLKAKLNAISQFVHKQRLQLRQSLATFMEEHPKLSEYKPALQAFETCLDSVIECNTDVNQWGINELHYPSLT